MTMTYVGVGRPQAQVEIPARFDSIRPCCVCAGVGEVQGYFPSSVLTLLVLFIQGHRTCEIQAEPRLSYQPDF